MLFHSFLGRSNIFLQHLIHALFSFGVCYFDFRELSREPGSLHSPIKSPILQVIPSWKYFNFLARLHTCILYVSCEIQKSPQHILAPLVRPIFAEDAINVTPRIPVRPDWRIRTEFGVRDHILGLFTCFFFQSRTCTCGYGSHLITESKYHIHIKRTTIVVVSIKIYTHIPSPVYKYKTLLFHLQIRARNLHVLNPY